jgi:hypothetical protein
MVTSFVGGLAAAAWLVLLCLRVESVKARDHYLVCLASVLVANICLKSTWQRCQDVELYIRTVPILLIYCYPRNFLTAWAQCYLNCNCYTACQAGKCSPQYVVIGLLPAASEQRHSCSCSRVTLVALSISPCLGCHYTGQASGVLVNSTCVHTCTYHVAGFRGGAFVVCITKHEPIWCIGFSLFAACYALTARMQYLSLAVGVVYIWAAAEGVSLGALHEGLGARRGPAAVRKCMQLLLTTHGCTGMLHVTSGLVRSDALERCTHCRLAVWLKGPMSFLAACASQQGPRPASPSAPRARSRKHVVYTKSTAHVILVVLR